MWFLKIFADYLWNTGVMTVKSGKCDPPALG